MSQGIYSIFDRDVEGADLQFTGEGLALNFEAIDTIAGAAKLTPLSAFADNREIPEDFDGDPDELVLRERIIAAWGGLFRQFDIPRQAAKTLAVYVQ